jgi:hypothetical protein
VSPYFSVTVDRHNVLRIFEHIAFMVVAWLWIRYDSRQFDVKVDTGLFIMIILLPIIGFPYYFFRNFGFSDGAVKTCLFIGYVILVSVCSMIATFGIIRLSN